MGAESCFNCGAALERHDSLCPCNGRPPRHLYFAVADLVAPAAEPFAVVRIDTSKPVDGGAEGIVDSLHWSRDVADLTAANLNFLALAEDIQTGVLQ